MADKINVVYIGSKPVKKTALTGKKLVFRQGVAVPVEADHAFMLLEYADVFATEADAEKVMKQIAEDAEKREQAIAKKAAEQKKEIVEQSFLVLVDGDEKDISKYTMAKLKTVIAAEDLDIVTDNVDVKIVREAVRTALHTKHGNPEA